MTIREIKAKAREDLSNNIFSSNWLLALVGCMVSSMVISAGSIAMGIGQLILVGPMTIGLYAAFLKSAREKSEFDIGHIFAVGFSNDFGRQLLIGLLKTIFVILWSLLLVIPGIIMSYAYAMTEYIAVDHPEYDWKQCIDASKTMMKGHKWELFVLELSFIGWIIVGCLCLGIGTLWVEAYITAARTEFYRNLIGDYNSYAYTEEI